MKWTHILFELYHTFWKLSWIKFSGSHLFLSSGTIRYEMGHYLSLASLFQSNMYMFHKLLVCCLYAKYGTIVRLVCFTSNIMQNNLQYFDWYIFIYFYFSKKKHIFPSFQYIIYFSYCRQFLKRRYQYAIILFSRRLWLPFNKKIGNFYVYLIMKFLQELTLTHFW